MDFDVFCRLTAALFCFIMIIVLVLVSKYYPENNLNTNNEVVYIYCEEL